MTVLWRDNFCRYWREHLVHISQGMAVGVLSEYTPVGAVCLMAGLLAYQFGSWLRKRDTVGIDSAYIAGGVAIGICIVLPLNLTNVI